MKSNQCQAIIEYLQSGKKLTALEALWKFGCNRLAARVNDLRREGFGIKSEIVSVNTANGQRAHVAQYSMDGLL